MTKERVSPPQLSYQAIRVEETADERSGPCYSFFDHVGACPATLRELVNAEALSPLSVAERRWPIWSVECADPSLKAGGIG